ncbi:PQ-loop domain-containing transporter [Mycoplasmopsis cricetuli]|uniref:PQ-loop domain-containing transporter n=1 Tax=Mycoplasmopsis cricetuli TaxID=171283 RepID=UPI00046E6BC0|nr:PQ-loop domain-containing transporter [Mycoplasmopsis cricetuli]
MILNVFNSIFSWLTVIITVSLSIPQLIKLFKEKQTKNISFVSFWIFHLGILMWTIFGVLSDKSIPYKLQNIVIADGLSLVLNGIMTYFLYHFKFKRNIQNYLIKRLFAAAGVIATWTVGFAFIVIYFKNSSFRISSNTAAIFSVIAPALTTFAFAPQLYVSIKTNKWKGISPFMFILFEINNLAWIGFWLTSIFIHGINLDLIGGLIWQIISLLLYGYQLVKISTAK